MTTNHKYLVIDIGTGNVRVAVTNTAGQVLLLASDDIVYQKDDAYSNSLFFDPEQLWQQILDLIHQIVSPEIAQDIIAISTSSQREGIVVLDQVGRSLLGMPNIDHRGREFEHILTDKDSVYQLTGRYPTSLFSAFKLYGLAQKHPEVSQRVTSVLSISEWALFKVSGQQVYEHSQASETLLYDVKYRKWSDELCELFQIQPTILPPLTFSGTIVGTVEKIFAEQFNLSYTTQVIVGGADTQLAIESTLPSPHDVILVSGTTTPIVQIVDTYITDAQQRTWTNSHTTPNCYILETNAGVTGLNYQRYKAIFYPNEAYEVMEAEIQSVMQSSPQCYAALGSLICDEKSPLLKGGFIFDTPIAHTLSRGHFTFALMWDIACSIYENYQSLIEITSYHKGYVWACGGGVQSPILRQFLANLLQKEIRLRPHFRQSSASGCAFICNRALGMDVIQEEIIDSTFPDTTLATDQWYQAWKNNRVHLKNSWACK